MRIRVLIVAVVLALACSAVLASDMSYSFVQGSWASVEPEVGDSGTGPVLDVSWGVSRMVHLVGSYEDVDFDTTDASMWQLGAGLHHTVAESFDMFGEASYVDSEVATFSEDGFAVTGGLRKPLGQSWEINGGVDYVEIGDVDDTLVGVNALYTMMERYSITAGYKVGDNDTMHVGFRWNFGQR